MWNYLQQIDPTYAQRAVTFVERISPVLDTIVNYFPYYTRHDALHGYQVVERMGQILQHACFEPGNPVALSAQEAYLLISAAYAHDLGMTVFPGEEDRLRLELELQENPHWQTAPALSKMLRDNHSSRGLFYIRDHAEELDLPLNLISILGDMMRAHNLSIHELEVQLSKRVAAGAQEIDLKQLACILCIADALEFSDTRVIDGVLDRLKEQVGETARVSYRENMKHVCIGDSVAVGRDDRVIFTGSFREADVLALAHKTIDLAADWVRQYCLVESGSGKPRLRLKADVFIRNLDLPGYDFERLGVQMKKENVISLIASNATWSNEPSVAVRELLQNAVEACRYRNHLTPTAKGYQPRVDVVLNRGDRTIDVIDNGCGMSKTVILNNLLTVGNSRADDPTYQSQGYHSLARFGIGFWSVFTIAKEAIVQTAPFETLTTTSAPEDSIAGMKFTVSLDEFKDFTVFAPLRRPAGTTIRLHLKEDADMDAILGGIQGALLCSAVPLFITVVGERTIQIPPNPRPLDAREMFAARWETAQSNKVDVFQWESETDGLEVALSIAFRDEDGKATLLLENHVDSILRLKSLSVGRRAGVCGFVVPLPLRTTCLDLGRVGDFAVNVKDPRGFRYRLDRRTLLPSKEQVSAVKNATRAFQDGFREFLKLHNCYNPPDIFRLNFQSRLHGGETVDVYTNDQLPFAFENGPDLVCLELREVDSQRSFDNASVDYLDLSQLANMPPCKIWVCQHFHLGDDHHFAEHSKLEGLVYKYAQRLKPATERAYVSGPYVEASLLFDNSHDVTIHVIPMGNSERDGKFELYVAEISTDVVRSETEHSWVIAQVRGRWSGTIYERPLKPTVGRKEFVFLGRHRLVVQKGSRLAEVIRLLASEGKTFAMAELASKLHEASNGYVNEELAREWPELFE